MIVKADFIQTLQIPEEQYKKAWVAVLSNTNSLPLFLLRKLSIFKINS